MLDTSLSWFIAKKRVYYRPKKGSVRLSELINMLHAKAKCDIPCDVQKTNVLSCVPRRSLRGISWEVYRRCRWLPSWLGKRQQALWGWPWVWCKRRGRPRTVSVAEAEARRLEQVSKVWCTGAGSGNFEAAQGWALGWVLCSPAQPQQALRAEETDGQWNWALYNFL